MTRNFLKTKDTMINLPLTTIHITEIQGDLESTAECFLDGKYEIISRSGLSRTEAHLIEAIPQIPAGAERLLVLGNRTGAIAMIATQVHPGLQAIVSSLDLFHHHAVERNLLRNAAPGVSSRCEPYIPERDYFDAVCLQISQGTTSNELILDLLQQSHLALKIGGRCCVTVEEEAPWVAEHIKKFFKNCSIRGQKKGSTLLMAQKKAELKSLKVYEAEFTMTLPKGLPAILTTLPGVFAHRRVDPGAQALAEMAETQPNDAILDMGCGCGSIGISLAKNQPTASVCFVDAHSRATAITQQNCFNNGITNFTVLLSDNGVPPPPRFTLFVGNPPYYSHDRITDFFIRTAFDALLPGGRAYIVAKIAAHPLEYMKEVFGNAELLHRRGYQIVKSVKS
jgi:16S rRNA (guanine1207-N2)-methyltransferase